MRHDSRRRNSESTEVLITGHPHRVASWLCSLAGLFFATPVLAAFNVSVVASGKSSGGAWSGNTWTANASGATLPASEIETHLASGDTTISTGTDGSEQGNISVDSALNWSDYALTLHAGRDIAIGAALTGTGAASLTLEYGQDAPAAGNNARYDISVPVHLQSNPTDPTNIPNFSTKQGYDGSVDARAVPTCPVIGRGGVVTSGCSFLKYSDLTALDLQYSTVQVNGQADSDTWVFLDQIPPAGQTFYPYVMSCLSGNGTLYFPNNKDQSNYFDSSGTITDLTNITSLTTTTRPCKDWASGPVIPLFSTADFPHGYYLKFHPNAGEVGRAYQRTALLVTDQPESNTAYSVTDYIINVLPSPPTVSTARRLDLPVAQQGSASLTLTGTGPLSVTASSSNTTVLPASGISGASSCTAAGSCTLTITPAAGVSGQATVTLTVNDDYGQHGTATLLVAVGQPLFGGGSGGALDPLTLAPLLGLARRRLHARVKSE